MQGKREQIVVAFHQRGFLQGILRLPRQLPEMQSRQILKQIDLKTGRKRFRQGGSVIALKLLLIPRINALGKDQLWNEHPLHNLVRGLKNRLRGVLAAQRGK